MYEVTFEEWLNPSSENETWEFAEDTPVNTHIRFYYEHAWDRCWWDLFPLSFVDGTLTPYWAKLRLWEYSEYPE